MSLLRRYPFTVLALTAFGLLVVVLLWHNHQAKRDCEARGGIWLRRDHACVPGWTQGGPR